MNTIQLKNIGKTYWKNNVVQSLNMEVRAGERLVLLGPSGCGKSTILRMIAGLEEISSGDLLMAGKKVNHIDCGERDISMVFQNYSLYPHMTVKKNITYGLTVNKVSKDDIKKRLSEVLTMLELNSLEDRLPRELSGGQRQRVALARAVVKQSSYFLLDEPLSNLDAQLRVVARKELVKIHDTFKQTMVYVTHDQVEAMAIGHRIAILNKGDLQMLDTPENVYHKPLNIFVARFIGSPSMNVLDCLYFDGRLQFKYNELELSNPWKEYLADKNNEVLKFGIRPEHVKLSEEKEANSLHATVDYVENYGEKYGVHLIFESEEFIVLSDQKKWEKGQEVFITPLIEKIHLFDRVNETNIGYPQSENQMSMVY